MDDHTVTGRVVAILDALAAAPLGGPVPLALLTAMTDIPKPTVRRIANDLAARNLVHHGPGGYSLGPRLVTLGSAAQRQVRMIELCTPFVHELHARTGGIAWVGSVHGLTIDILDRVHSREHTPLLATAWPEQLSATALPSTAAAQLVLARHPEAVPDVFARGLRRMTRHTVVQPRLYGERVGRVAESGVATEWEECRLGWWCAVAEVTSGSAPVVIGVTLPTAGTVTSRLLTILRRARDELSAELIHTGGAAAPQE